MGGFFAFVAIYATDDLGLSGSGEVLLLFGLIVVVTRIAFAKLPDRVSPFRLGAVALAFCATGLGTAAVFVGVPGLLVGAALLAVGVAFTTPAIFAAIFARVPASERGAASGTASLFIDLGFGGGPMLLGIVAGSAGIPAAFLVAALIAAVGAAGSALLSVDRRSAIASRVNAGCRDCRPIGHPRSALIAPNTSSGVSSHGKWPAPSIISSRPMPGGRPSRISSAAVAIRGSFEPTHTSVGLVILGRSAQEIQLHQQLPAAAVDLGVLDPTRKLFLAGHARPEGGEHPRRLVVGDVLARVIASRQGRDLVAGLAPEPLDQAVQVEAGEGAEQDQSAAMARMTRSVKDRDEAAHRMAKDDRPFDPERIAERANVVGAGLEGPGGGIAPR